MLNPRFFKVGAEHLPTEKLLFHREESKERKGFLWIPLRSLDHCGRFAFASAKSLILGHSTN